MKSLVTGEIHQIHKPTLNVAVTTREFTAANGQPSPFKESEAVKAMQKVASNYCKKEELNVVQQGLYIEEEGFAVKILAYKPKP